MTAFLKQVMRFSCLLLVGLIALVGLYVYLDPFKVVKTYTAFYEENAQGGVELNKDYVSTMTYLRQVKTEGYNAFIFGNSRSIFYQVDDWRQHLGPQAACFHFDASGESLWALEKKVAYISQNGGSLDDVLLVLDAALLEQVTPKTGHLFTISPELVHHSNVVDFHTTAFMTFIRPKFLYAYLDYWHTGTVKPYMKKLGLLDDSPFSYCVQTNEIRYDAFEQQIAENAYYTPARIASFMRERRKSGPRIQSEQKRLLGSIQAIARKHSTRVKVIISPLYDQIPFDATDLDYLKELFGATNVLDASGVNDITADYTNYYESSHYRPHVAKMLLDSVYALSESDLLSKRP